LTLAALTATFLAAQPCHCPAQDEASDDGGASALIRSVIDRYESSDSYRIDFIQESYWSLADTLFVTEGILLLERPLNMSIVYDDGSRIVSNGESLWVYTAKTGQHFATAVDSGDVVIDPPRLLRQYGVDPDGRFPSPKACQTSGPDPAPATGLSFRPTHGASEPATLDVLVDERNGTVAEIVAHSRSGDFTRYRIVGTRFDVSIDADAFDRIRPPASPGKGVAPTR
jgi:outer membrane lipoprotein-sorting protein